MSQSAVQQPFHATRPSMNGDFTVPQDSFDGRQPSMGGLRDRHGSTMPQINTNRGQPLPDMNTPGTSYDMNFTPLLPSNLLMSSPFQPGSPTTFTPSQFQGFDAFPQAGHAQQQGMQGSNGMSQGVYPGLVSPAGMGAAQAYGNGYGQPQQHNGFTSMGAMFGGGMPMNPVMPGTSRTVYLGNIPQETTAEEILGHVRSGQIESVRLLPDKNCAFISFLDASCAVHFHSDAILKKLQIRGQEIKIGWGKPSQVPSSVALAVQQSAASRNVYLGNLPSDITDAALREELGKFGPIDTVKLVREKNIGFVHFLSISNAIKAVAQLPQEPNWQPPRRVYYGKDRCAYVSKTQQQNAAQYLGIAPGYAHMLNAQDKDMLHTAFAQQSVQAATIATAAGGVNNLGNRTVYLGNIHPETTTEEICNVVRGGLLHHIRYIQDKHICFVTFIDPNAAANFFLLSTNQGLMIHNRRLKVGWGKHSGALPPAIALAVSGGASRNVYIGNIDDEWTEERLRSDFTDYGDIELVNTLREKSCAFVNFTNIANAIKAIEAVRSKDEYKRFKVNFGKDRCGNPPRQNHHHHNNQNAMAQDMMSSPTANGGMQYSNGGPSDSPNGMMSPMGMNGHMNGSMNGSMNGGMMPNGMGGLQGSDINALLSAGPGQMQGPPDHNQTPSPFQNGAKSHSSKPSSNGFLGSDINQGFMPGHGSSSSFSVAGGGNVPVNGGLLSPSNMTAAQRAQHARAVSMPAFGPGNPGQPGQPQQNGGFSGLGSGLGGLGGSSPYGLAIQGETSLPRWAEEEVS